MLTLHRKIAYLIPFGCFFFSTYQKRIANIVIMFQAREDFFIRSVQCSKFFCKRNLHKYHHVAKEKEKK